MPPLPTHFPRKQAGYMRQLLQCLQAVHARGIAHRDLKAENVLYSPDTSRLRVVDWGLAKQLKACDLQSSDPGTPNWKAPELLLKIPHSAFKTDIFAAGAMLGCLLFGGQKMFLGQNSDYDDQLRACAGWSERA